MATRTAASHVPSGSRRRAVVLGAGGVVGTAWMAGLLGGMRGAGVDLAEADLIVGTSAGAIIGAVLATGQNPDRLATPPRPADSDIAPPQMDRRRLGEVFAVLGAAGSDPDEATARVFGQDLHDRSAWQPSYRAGVRQAAETVQRVRAAWQAPAVEEPRRNGHSE
ncbi:patatin-like phospholipase family protein [Streptomyces inhibens]|uniref:patatin-like phospholipase family protein n=1 Tax=Streptomyces inhibens TaxID=2293571 RepID=UPI00402AF968